MDEDSHAMSAGEEPNDADYSPSGRRRNRRASTGQLDFGDASSQEGPGASKARLMAAKKRLEEAASSTYQTLLERLQPAVDSLGETAFANVEDRFRYVTLRANL